MDISKLLGIKIGYDLNDKEEFKLVRKYIIANGYSVSNFDKNLNSLILEVDMHKKVISAVTKYDPYNNRIDGKAFGIDFIHELFHMASCLKKGLNELGAMFKDGTGESLNEGIVEYLTLCVCGEGRVAYPMEVLFLECLNQIYPDKVHTFMSKFFEGKPDELYDSFGEDRDLILSAVKELDKFTRDTKNNFLYAAKILNMKNNQENTIRIRTSEAFVKQEIINEELTNAFSIILNKLKSVNESLAYDLFEDFKDTVESYYKEDAEAMISLLEAKLGMVKEL